MATLLSGTSVTTTAFAPIVTLLPIEISPNRQAPAPIIQFSPIVGQVYEFKSFLPIVTF